MKLSAEIRAAVVRVVEASLDQSWAGSRPPQEHEAIALRVAAARVEFNALMQRVDQLESKEEKRS